MTLLTLQSAFSSAHFYHQPAWSDEKNREVFGRCFTPYGHGHNYLLEVSFVVSLEEALTLREEKQKRLDDLTRVLDHEHLNFVIPEFARTVPTTENIALYFQEKLKNEKIKNLKIYETPQLWSELSL